MTAKIVDMDTSLTPAQRTAWRDHWRSRDRVQAKLAEELAMLEVTVRGKAGRKKASTWTVELSNFFDGDEDAMMRILSDDRVADKVAKRLGLDDAGGLRAVLSRVRGIEEDGPLDVRRAGFEDYGPVRADLLYVAPPAGGSHGEGMSDLFPPTMEKLVAVCGPARVGRSITVTGGTGLGKTTMLRALRARLIDLGMRVADRVVEDADVVVLDDAHRLPPRVLAEAKEWVARSRGLVMLARGDDSPEALGQAHATVQIPALNIHWVCQSLPEVARQLNLWRGLTFDVAALQAWLEDDPTAGYLVRDFRALGAVLRAAVEHGVSAVATRASGRSRIVVDLASRRLAGDPITGRFVQTCGPALLQEIAAQQIAAGRPTLDSSAVASAVADLARRYGASLGAEGAFRPVDALVRVGVLAEDREGRIGLATPTMALPAAADRWTSLLPRMLVWEPAHDALAAAAERHGDPVLRAALEVDPEVACVGVLGLTRVLCAEAPYTDGPAWLRAFRLCATWWAHAPKSVGAPTVGRLAAPASERIDSWSPLLLLAQAARRNARLLPGRLAPLDIDELPTHHRAWLNLFSVASPSAEALDAVLRFVAPAHVGGFPAPGDLRHGMDWTESRVPGLHPGDYEVWWRTCLVPMWRASTEGTRLLAGTADPSLVVVACYQGSYQSTTRGLDLWLDALSSRVAAGDPGAPDAIRAAIAFAFERGGTRVQDAIATRLPGWVRVRRYLRVGLLERLAATTPRSYHDVREDQPRPLLARVLGEVVDSEEVAQLWEAWAKPEQDDIPWRAFLLAGLPQVRVAEWAIATFVPVKPALPFLGEEPFSVHENRRRAIEHVAAGDDFPTLMLIHLSSLPWRIRRAALAKLEGVDPAAWRSRRIEAALTTDTMRRYELLRGVRPGPEDQPAWERVIATSKTLSEYLERVAQWCAAQAGPDRWRDLIGALTHIESLWKRKRKGRLPHELDMVANHGASGMLSHVCRTDLSGPEDRHEVVRRLLSHPIWARAMGHWSKGGIWGVASAILPPEEFETLLRQRVDTLFGEDARPGWLWSLMVDGQFERVVRYLQDPELGPAAAQALSGLNYGDKTWPLAQLESILGQGPLREDGVVDRLVVLAARHDAEGTLSWLDRKLADVPPAVARAWWSRVIPTLPPDAALAAAKRWFS